MTSFNFDTMGFEKDQSPKDFVEERPDYNEMAKEALEDGRRMYGPREREFDTPTGQSRRAELKLREAQVLATLALVEAVDQLRATLHDYFQSQI